MNKEKYLLTIKAEERAGLLHSVTGLIERKHIEIKSLNLAPTDIHDVVMITIEVAVSESELTSLAFKLEKIIEVFSVQVTKYDQAVCLRATYFKVAKGLLETPQIAALQKHGAIIVNWYADAFLIAQHGTDTSILNLYNELDGPYLLGFTQTGLISDRALLDDVEGRVIKLSGNANSDEYRIHGLAA
ncbi:MAG: ACT domain-containing protein [Bacteroidota bacterium]